MKLLIDGYTLSTPEIDRGIGQVFKNLVEHLLLYRTSDLTYISIEHEDQLLTFSPWARETLKPVISAPLNIHGSQEERNSAYRDQIQAIVDTYGIDAYLNPNPMMVNSYLPLGLKNCVFANTLYDLIPLQLDKKILAHWPAEIQSEYLRRCHGIGLESDLIFGISHDACLGFGRRFSDTTADVIAAPIAHDSDLFWPLPMKPTKASGERAFILMVGGDDTRKNINGAIEAFAEFVKAPTEPPHDLVIACHLSEATQKDLLAQAEGLGIADRLTLTGFVSDTELSSLYRNADVSIFPSYVEGFGLPILESMASGTMVVSSDMPTALEIGGDLIEYAAPFDPVDISQKMHRALQRLNEEPDLPARLVAHAQTFNWQRTARQYDEKLRQAVKQKHLQSAPTSKLKIAMLTPWRPESSGIATYCWNVAEYLSKKCDLTIVTNDQPQNHDPMSGVSLMSIDAFAAATDDFDQIILHIGNNEAFHAQAHKWALQNTLPLLIILHDVNIHPFMQFAYLKTDQTDQYFNALDADFPAGESESLKSKVRRKDSIDIFETPMSRHLLKLGHVMVHNRWSYETLMQYDDIPAPFEASVFPLGFEPSSASIEQNSTAEYFEIVAPGFVNQFKRPTSCIDAYNRLREAGLNVRLTFLGTVNSDVVDIEALTTTLVPNPEHQKDITVTGFVDDETFHKILTNADLIWNLRNPSMGESSATLQNSLALGKATLISDYAQFKEYPDSVAWKVPVGSEEAFQLFNMSAFLLANRSVRDQLGQTAKQWGAEAPSFEDVADHYIFLSHKLQAATPNQKERPDQMTSS